MGKLKVKFCELLLTLIESAWLFMNIYLPSIYISCIWKRVFGSRTHTGQIDFFISMPCREQLVKWILLKKKKKKNSKICCSTEKYEINLKKRTVVEFARLQDSLNTTKNWCSAYPRKNMCTHTDALGLWYGLYYEN